MARRFLVFSLLTLATLGLSPSGVFAQTAPGPTPGHTVGVSRDDNTARSQLQRSSALPPAVLANDSAGRPRVDLRSAGQTFGAARAVTPTGLLSHREAAVAVVSRVGTLRLRLHVFLCTWLN